MNTLIHLLPEEAVYRLGWTLVHFVWEGTAIALLVALVLAVMRRGTANGRYVAGCAGLLAMVAAVGVTFGVLEGTGKLAKRPALAAGSLDTNPEGGRDARPPGGDAWTVMVEGAGEASGFTPPKPPLGKGGQDGAASQTSTQSQARTRHDQAMPSVAGSTWAGVLAARLEPYLAWLVAAWLAGMLALSVRLLGGWVQVQRVRRRLVEQVAPRWQEVMQELAERLRMSRPVRLLVSATEQAPMAVGWLRPVVLVPVSALTGLTAEQLRAVLAHELAHIRRYDYLVNIVQSAIETVLFYHPAVWWVSRRVRVEREHCCDDAAVEVCGGALRYARALERLETLRGGPVRLAAAANGASLLARVRRLVVPQSSESARWSGWLAGAIPLVLIAGLTLSISLTAARGGSQDANRSATTPTNPNRSEHVATRPAENGYRLRHFVRIVVGGDRMTFQGKDTTWEKLPELLKDVPGRAVTVLEVAVASQDVTLRELNEARGKALELAHKFKFEYLSYIGEHALGSMGSPSLWVSATPLATPPSTPTTTGDDRGRAQAQLHIERAETSQPTAPPTTTRPGAATERSHLNTELERRLRATPVPAGAVRFEIPWGMSLIPGSSLATQEGKLRWHDGRKELLLDVERGNVHVLWNDGEKRGEQTAAVVAVPTGGEAPGETTVIDVVEGLLRIQWPKDTILVMLGEHRLALLGNDGSLLTFSSLKFSPDGRLTTQSSASPISVRGVVRLPDGSPAAGAQVVLVAPGHEARFEGTRYNGQINTRTEKPLSGMSVRTDAAGEFEFPEECDGIALAAVHESGFADLHRRAGTHEYEIRLQPWARVEGTVYRGRVASGDQTLEFTSARAYDAKGSLEYGWTRSDTTAGIHLEQSLQTSLTGEFVFEKAPPGRCWLSPKMSYGISGGDAMVELKPGENRRLMVGAARTVTGRLVTDKKSGVVITPANTQFRVILYPPPFSGPMEGINASFQAYGEFLKTPLGKPYARDPAPLGEDGSFTLHDLPPGRYLFQVWVFELAPPPGSPPGTQVVQRGEPIARLDRELAVEDLGEGPEGKVMELGELTVRATEHSAKPAGDAGAATQPGAPKADLETLLRQATDADEWVRRDAVQALGELRDPRAIETLIGALRDDERRVRYGALYALGNISDPRSVEAVANAHLRDPDGIVRRVAARTLRTIGGVRAAEALTAGMGDADASVREEAAKQLGAMDWKAPNEDVRLRQLIYAGKPEEAAKIGQTAKPAAADKQRAEGNVELDRPILVNIGAAIDEHYEGRTKWIEFSRTGKQLEATVCVRYVSGPKAKWRISVEIFGDDGSVVRRGQKEFENSGVIAGLPVIGDELFRVQLGADLEGVEGKRFAVRFATLTPNTTKRLPETQPTPLPAPGR